MKTTKSKIRCGGMLGILVLALGLMVWPVEVSKAAPMGTAFTYQSRLMDANQPADGLYDFMFRLFDAPDGPGELGAQGIHDLDVIDGYFTVELDFGSDVFDGDARWLEIGVRSYDPCDVNAFTTLSPRQEITPVPYALQTRGIFVDNALNVGIGTTSPDAELHVRSGTGDSVSTILMEAPLYALRASFGAWGPPVPNGAYLGTYTNHGLHFHTGGGPVNIPDYIRMSILANGKVGIGTTTPTTKLDVVGTVNATAFVGDGSGLTGIAGDSDWTISGNDMYTGAGVTGNVGIGTSSPAAKLNVNGDALFHNIVDEDTSVDIRSGAADTYAALRLLNSSGTVNGIFGYDQENDTVHLVHDSTFLPSMKGIIIDNNGKVSIGSGGGQFFALLSVNNLPGVDPFNIGGSPTSIPLFIVKNSGKVGIGTNNPQGTLDVNGDIFQRGISLHADYVFESDYKVESIEEHSEFMWQEKHLSAIPKAKVDEVGKQIVEVGAHRRGIVEELEKAHIYIEQLHKRVKTLEEKLMKLEAGLNAVQ